MNADGQSRKNNGKREKLPDRKKKQNRKNHENLLKMLKLLPSLVHARKLVVESKVSMSSMLTEDPMRASP